jgi:hypothetical protein
VCSTRGRRTRPKWESDAVRPVFDIGCGGTRPVHVEFGSLCDKEMFLGEKLNYKTRKYLWGWKSGGAFSAEQIFSQSLAL